MEPLMAVKPWLSVVKTAPIAGIWVDFSSSSLFFSHFWVACACFSLHHIIVLPTAASKLCRGFDYFEMQIFGLREVKYYCMCIQVGEKQAIGLMLAILQFAQHPAVVLLFLVVVICFHTIWKHFLNPLAKNFKGNLYWCSNGGCHCLAFMLTLWLQYFELLATKKHEESQVRSPDRQTCSELVAQVLKPLD